jgi:hypothetical protein
MERADDAFRARLNDVLDLGGIVRPEPAPRLSHNPSTLAMRRTTSAPRLTVPFIGA